MPWTSTTQPGYRPWSSRIRGKSNSCLTDTIKSAKLACIAIQNCMEEMHSADLGTCGKAEACAPISQQVLQRQSRNASWCLILDLPRLVFDEAQCDSGLKSFRMPKYHTVDDVFSYVYPFWRNPITSPQLCMLRANYTDGYGWKGFYQLRSFFQDQNYPIRLWKSLIPIGCDQWDLNKSDYSERAR